MGSPARQLWEPPEFALIVAYIQITTFHPTAGDIGNEMGISGVKLTPILNEMLQRGRIKRGGRGVASRRNGGYYLPDEEIVYHDYPLCNLSQRRSRG